MQVVAVCIFWGGCESTEYTYLLVRYDPVQITGSIIGVTLITNSEYFRFSEKLCVDLLAKATPKSLRIMETESLIFQTCFFTFRDLCCIVCSSPTATLYLK
jgi:hypothetical protein